ncbi:MAG: hypothetical protein ABIO17_05940 [Pseudoxanthomonas sp.]
MVGTLATVTVFLSGLYLIALGVLSLLRPAQGSRFLLGFATSARLHYVELLLRILVGFAFVVEAPNFRFELPFSVFGWVLVGSTVFLFLIPWQWHRRFAQQAVPHAVRYLGLVGFASLVLGGCILAAVTVR